MLLPFSLGSRRFGFRLTLFRIWALIVLLPFAATAAPLRTSETGEKMSALVSPSGARVCLERVLLVTDGATTFDLPPGADVQSLDLTLADREVIGLETTLMPRKPGPAAAVLLAELSAARRALATLQGQKASLDARIALWTTPSAKRSSPEALEKIDALMTARIASLHAERAELEPRITDAAQTVQRLETELGKVGGEPGEIMRITAKVHPVDDGTVRARLVFMLDGCGWKPTYRIEALPSGNMVRVTRLAELHQQTGFAWNNVALTLTTADSSARLDPQPLQPWVIRPFPEHRSTRNRDAGDALERTVASLGSGPAAIAVKASGTPPPVPSYVENTVSGSWNLGIRNVPTGIPVRLKLSENEWKADFVRVLRPSRHRFAFLQADASPPEPVALPRGEALFLVDGLGVGKGNFAFNGSKGEIFFGEDVHVRGEMKADMHQSGSRGFISKQQTRARAWDIVVHNAHTVPVAVRVEEPAPQLRAEELAVDLQSSPSPELDGHEYIWRLHVPAGETACIRHALTITAPADMRLDDGR